MAEPIANHIYTGDCLEIMRSWPDACIDHCIADPPFGIASGRGRKSKRGLGWAFSSHVTMQEAWDQFTEDEYFRFSVDWLREVCRVVKPNGNILVFGTFHNIYLLGFLLGHVLERRILNSIVWFKPNAQPNITARTLTESTEQIVWAVNETPKRAKGWTFNYEMAKQLAGDKQMRNFWKWDELDNVISAPVVSSRQRKHPSQKPSELVDQLVRLTSRANDLILDPFAGSGVVGLSALRYRRQYALIEAQPEYVAAATAAIKQFPKTVRGRLLARTNGIAALTYEELDALADIPVPQADDLDLVFAVPKHVRSGANTRAKVAKELTYVPRQGPYYSDAAMALGLIRAVGAVHRGGKTLEVAPMGARWLSARASERDSLRRDILLAAPIVKFIAGRLRTDPRQLNLSPLLFDEKRVATVLQELDLSPETARRRAITLCRWLGRITNHAPHRRGRSAPHGRS